MTFFRKFFLVFFLMSFYCLSNAIASETIISADLAPGQTHSTTAWVGVSDCPSCIAMGKVKFRINFTQLNPGQIYSLTLKTSYHLGSRIYEVGNVSGSASILNGQRKIFFDQGFTKKARNNWQIQFRANTQAVSMDITNNGVVGEAAFLYLSSVELNLDKTAIQEENMYTVGGSNHTGNPIVDSSEFLSNSLNPIHVVKSGDMTTVRGWIGISDCSGCPSSPAYQTLQLNDLIPGRTYQLTVHFSYFWNQTNLFAQVVSGGVQWFHGDIKNLIKHGPARNADQWIMEFSAVTPSLSIKLGLAPIAPNYVYIDFFRLSEKVTSYLDKTPEQLSNWIKLRDNQSYAESVTNFDGKGNYAWYEIYLMQAYVDAFKLTGDFHWIEKLVHHADTVLQQRDSIVGKLDYRGRSGPVWQETAKKYAWIGFSGGLFMPLVELGYLVAENDSLRSKILQDGRNLFTLTQNYIMAYHEVLNFYSEDWVEHNDYAYYQFPSDLDRSGVVGAEALKNKAVAYDFGAFMGINYINLSKYYKLVENNAAASLYLTRALKYARFFRSQMKWNLVTNGLLWDFSQYYQNSVDDIGHANVNVLFLAKSYEANLEISESDLQGVANTYESLLYENADIGATLINGVDDTSFGLNNSTFYFSPVACFSSTLEPKIPNVINYHGSGIVDTLTWASWKKKCQ